MSTSFGWKGKGRYGSFHQQMNAGCAGKTEIPWERVPHLNTLEVFHDEALYKSTFTFTFTFTNSLQRHKKYAKLESYLVPNIRPATCWPICCQDMARCLLEWKARQIRYMQQAGYCLMTLLTHISCLISRVKTKRVTTHMHMQ